MATYLVSDIKTDVRVAIDQNMTSTALASLGDVDTLSMEDIVANAIVPGVRAVEQEAPTYMLGAGEDFSGDITWLERDTESCDAFLYTGSGWADAKSTSLTQGGDELITALSDNWAEVRSYAEQTDHTLCVWINATPNTRWQNKAEQAEHEGDIAIIVSSASFYQYAKLSAPKVVDGVTYYYWWQDYTPSENLQTAVKDIAGSSTSASSLRVFIGTETPTDMTSGDIWMLDALKVGQGSGSLLLPNDFFRLITFRMSDWVRAVTTAISEDDPQYELQGSRWSGIRGTPQKPIVALVMTEDGLSIEFYSCTDSKAEITRARYLPMPVISTNSEGNEVMDIPSKLYTASIYRIAYKVAQAIKDDTLAQAMLTMSKDFVS